MGVHARHTHTTYPVCLDGGRVGFIVAAGGANLILAGGGRDACLRHFAVFPALSGLQGNRFALQRAESLADYLAGNRVAVACHRLCGVVWKPTIAQAQNRLMYEAT